MQTVTLTIIILATKEEIIAITVILIIARRADCHINYNYSCNQRGNTCRGSNGVWLSDNPAKDPTRLRATKEETIAITVIWIMTRCADCRIILHTFQICTILVTITAK